MKKIILIMAVILGFAANAKAQDAVGINLNMGTGDSYTNYGIGAKYQHGFTENWRAEASFNYYFKKDYVSMWDVNVNAQYVLPLGKLNVYPLAGVTFMSKAVEGFSSFTSFGINYGFGLELPVSSSMKIDLEVGGKTGFKSGWGTRGIISLGAAFNI